MTTIISRLAGVTIIRMVKFFIQLYSSNDYFVRFYWIGDRASTTREERGGGKRGFNSNIKRIIPALFVLQFECNWICPLLYPGSIRFRGYEFYTKSKIWLFQNFVSVFCWLFEYAFDWKKIFEFERLKWNKYKLLYLFNRKW